MKHSNCPRCQSQEFETTFSVCMNCNHGVDDASESGVPIPAWVLDYIDVTPAELAEIREINFGFRPTPLRMGQAPEKGDQTAPPEIAPLLRFNGRNLPFQTLENVETGQCVM